MQTNAVELTDFIDDKQFSVSNQGIDNVICDLPVSVYGLIKMNFTSLREIMIIVINESFLIEIWKYCGHDGVE